MAFQNRQPISMGKAFGRKFDALNARVSILLDKLEKVEAINKIALEGKGAKKCRPVEIIEKSVVRTFDMKKFSGSGFLGFRQFLFIITVCEFSGSEKDILGLSGVEI
jgi:hypothetical protein